MSIHKYGEIQASSEQIDELVAYNRGEITRVDNKTFRLLNLLTDPAFCGVLGTIEKTGVERGYCRFGEPHPQDVMTPIENDQEPTGIYFLSKFPSVWFIIDPMLSRYPMKLKGFHFSSEDFVRVS